MELDEYGEPTVEAPDAGADLLDVPDRRAPLELDQILGRPGQDDEVALEALVLAGAGDHPVVVEVGSGLTRLGHAPRGGGDLGQIPFERQFEAAFEGFTALHAGERAERRLHFVALRDQSGLRPPELGQVLPDLQIHGGPGAVREGAKLSGLPPLLDAEGGEYGEDDHERLDRDLAEPASPANRDGGRLRLRGDRFGAVVADRFGVRRRGGHSFW